MRKIYQAIGVLDVCIVNTDNGSTDARRATEIVGARWLTGTLTKGVTQLPRYTNEFQV
jgi:hypothetical protein